MKREESAFDSWAWLETFEHKEMAIAATAACLIELPILVR